jgi:hypothetical protein
MSVYQTVPTGFPEVLVNNDGLCPQNQYELKRGVPIYNRSSATSDNKAAMNYQSLWINPGGPDYERDIVYPVPLYKNWTTFESGKTWLSCRDAMYDIMEVWNTGDNPTGTTVGKLYYMFVTDYEGNMLHDGVNGKCFMLGENCYDMECTDESGTCTTPFTDEAGWQTNIGKIWDESITGLSNLQYFTGVAERQPLDAETNGQTTIDFSRNMWYCLQPLYNNNCRPFHVTGISPEICSDSKKISVNTECDQFLLTYNARYSGSNSNEGGNVTVANRINAASQSMCESSSRPTEIDYTYTGIDECQCINSSDFRLYRRLKEQDPSLQKICFWTPCIVDEGEGKDVWITDNTLGFIPSCSDINCGNFYNIVDSIIQNESELNFAESQVICTFTGTGEGEVPNIIGGGGSGGGGGGDSSNMTNIIIYVVIGVAAVGLIVGIAVAVSKYLQKKKEGSVEKTGIPPK